MQDQQQELFKAMKWQRDTLRRRLNAYNRWTMRPASIALSLLGIVVLVLWILTSDGSMMSSLLAMTGSTFIAIAVLMSLLTPNRYLRNEVYEAMCISDVVSINRILSSLLISSRGIYLPAKMAGSTKLFIPLSDNSPAVELRTHREDVFNISGRKINGLVIDPPGQGLFRYVQSIGALFTSEGLENEIKDVLENNLELASKVSVKTGGNTVTISMSNIACSNMCEAIRRDHPEICTRTGCPICSLAGCMVADGMGKKVRIAGVRVDGKKIRLALEILGDT